MKKNQQTSLSYSVSPTLQRAFIVFSLASLLTGVATMVYWMLKQTPDNMNFSGFLMPLIQSLVLPLILFVVAYYYKPRKLAGVPRVFESFIYATIGFSIMMVLSQIYNHFYGYLFILDTGYWTYIGYELAGMALAVALYVPLVAYLKRKS